jgi:hypothetical protein
MKILSIAVFVLSMSAAPATPLFAATSAAHQRSAEKWCRLHPDARESGADDEHMISALDGAYRIKHSTPDMTAVWKTYNEVCRGSTDHTLAALACKKRQDLGAKLERNGCIYGDHGAYSPNKDEYNCP